ncbi:hypothetical protein VKT23_015418 [Stygiomarasmius scandens]|uniref:Low temperature requirement A n=1 Tax=Marasmiellus scandens TaxID=2682957 RepID=A0ABR1IXJ9_9AGAR
MEPHRASKGNRASTFGDPSTDPRDSLVRQRRKNIVPLTRSPFIDSTYDSKERPSEFKVSVSNVPWSDLLLELAMTTTFASLTDGTPILEASSVASYLGFFALVWWIWASQVAYNVRFRQADWLHRLFVFLQVFVFCGLATFTKDFDVTNDIADDSQMNQRIANLEVGAFGQSQRPWISVERFRAQRLPTLNARGISMTMAISRVFLLIQYLVAFGHALRVDRRISKNTALLVHIGSLLISSLCYFIAFAIIGNHPSRGDQIVKFFFWYIPLFIEVTAHFIAISRLCNGRVNYDAKLVLARTCTAFVIILGNGLDRITNGFQYVVGNFRFTWLSLGVICCAVVIFLLMFSLYFGTSAPATHGMSNNRIISGFFFQFFHLSAVIVTLQCIAVMLKAGNLGSALDIPLEFLRDSKSIMQLKGFSVPLNESDYAFSDIETRLQNQAISLQGLLPFINDAIHNASQGTTPNYALPFNVLLQMDVLIIETVLDNLNMLQQSSDLVFAQLEFFLYEDPGNFTAINNSTFNDTVQMVIVQNSTPAMWFYAAGGAFLLTLGFVGLIRQWPRDKYEWGQVISRLILGSATIAVTAIDINASKHVLTADFDLGGSGIWSLVTHSWVLPPYALALLIEQIIELILLYLAGRSFGDFKTLLFLKDSRSPRISYSRTGTFDESVSSLASNDREERVIGINRSEQPEWHRDDPEYVNTHEQGNEKKGNEEVRVYQR